MSITMSYINYDLSFGACHLSKIDGLNDGRLDSGYGITVTGFPGYWDFSTPLLLSSGVFKVVL
jgi:hypothetical protein